MQIVVFKLGDEHFAVETEKVQGINDIMGITKVPNAPSHIKGLINLRGSIKSLVDINLLLNIDPSEEQENVIIISVDGEEIGISVDRVEEVLYIDEKKIQYASDKKYENYIKGIIQHEDNLLTIIDVEELLN